MDTNILNKITAVPTQSRLKGIGGSDIGAILQIDKYKTPYDVWDQKVNGAKQPDTYVMERGRFMEEFIAQKFADFYGYEIKIADTVLAYKDCDYFIASIDRFIINNDGDIGVLECKDTTKFVDAPIPSHFAQINWYLAITGCQFGYIAYNTPYEFKAFLVEKNDKLNNELMEIADLFWKDFVLTKTPPPPTNLNDAKNVYTRTIEGAAISANESIHQVLKQIKSYREQADDINKKIEELQFILINYIKDNEMLVDANNNVMATYKNVCSNRFDNKRFQKDSPELYSKYLTQINSRRLTIKYDVL